MVVEIVHVRDCPNIVVVRERLEHPLDRAGVVATIRERLVVTVEDAARLQMRGSPTILIEGVDPFADPGTPSSLSCRLFNDAGSIAGAPAVGELVAALVGKDGA